MVPRTAAVVFAAALLVPPAVRAEETLEELTARLSKAVVPWEGCEPGSWVQTKTRTKSGTGDHESEFRQILVSRTREGLTIETRQVTRTKDERGVETVQLGAPTTSIQPVMPTWKYENPKDLPRETVEVAGRKYDCRVVELEAVYTYPQPVGGKTEMRSKMTFWVSGEMKGFRGVVKTQGDQDNKAAPGMGMWSYDMKVVDPAREVKVAGKTLECVVVQYDSTSGMEESVTRSELWFCPDVPTGFARAATSFSYKSGGIAIQSESVAEVTGMEIVRPKTE